MSQPVSNEEIFAKIGTALQWHRVKPERKEDREPFLSRLSGSAPLMSNYTISTLDEVESGKTTPSLEELVVWCDVLEIDLCTLFDQARKFAQREKELLQKHSED